MARMKRLTSITSWLGRAIVVAIGALLPATTLAQTSGIRGTVRDAATGAPIQGVTVYAVSDRETGLSGGAGTNAAGEYTISNASGTYYLYVQRPFASQQYVNEIYPDIKCEFTCSRNLTLLLGTPVTVTAGSVTTGIDFSLETGGTVTGRVVDAVTGTPLQGVSVTVSTRVATGFQGSGTSTDASGVYTVRGLPGGQYFAYTSNALGYVDEIHNDVLCQGSCQLSVAVNSGAPIDVTLGQTRSGIDFALAQGGAVTGVVTDAATGTPLPNVTVGAYTRSNTFLRNAFTDAQGRYTVRGLATGAYVMRTTNSTSTGYLNEAFDNVPCADSVATCLNAAADVAVAAGNTTADKNFALDPGGQITGTVVNEATGLPPAPVSVSAYRVSGGVATFVASGFSNSTTGVFSIRGLSTGNYILSTRAFSTNSPTNLIDEYNDGSRVLSFASLTAAAASVAPVAVTAGAITSGVSFALTPGGTIAGTVTGVAADIQVSLYTVVGGSAITVASYTNSFEPGSRVQFGGLPTGAYFVTVQTVAASPATGFYGAQVWNGVACPGTCGPADAVAAGTPIAVTAGSGVSGINFTLQARNDAPGAPTLLTHTVENFGVRFSWQPPTSRVGGRATSYVLEAGISPGTTIASLTSNSPTLLVPGAPPGRYYIRVRGVNAAGTGPASSEIQITINGDGSGALGAPTSLSAFMSGGRLTATWAAPTSGGVPTSYILEAGSATGLSNIAAVNVTARSFTFDPVPPGFYFLRVKAIVGGNVSPASTEVLIVVGNVPTPPNAPTGMTHTVTGSTVAFTWTAPAGAAPTSYVLEAGSATGLADIVTFNTGNAATTVSFSGVPPGTYYVRVRAVNAQGAGLPSNERTLIVSP